MSSLGVSPRVRRFSRCKVQTLVVWVQPGNGIHCHIRKFQLSVASWTGLIHDRSNLIVLGFLIPKSYPLFGGVL